MTNNKSIKQYYANAFGLAWPCIIEMMLVSIVFIVDAMMVGNLGATATASVGVNQPVNWLINSLSSGIAVGGSVLVAMHYGADEISKARNVARQAVFSAMIFGSVMAVIVFNLSGYIPVWIGVDADVLPGAVYYLKILSLSLGFHFTGFVSSGILRGSGNTKTPMLIAMLTNLVNVVGNFFLIYPSRYITFLSLDVFMPGAGLGVKGAAIATTIAHCLSGCILISMLFDKDRKVHVCIDKSFRFQKNTLANILKIGLPTAGERCSINLGMVFFQSIVANLGTVAISGHYLSTTIESIAYMPAEGFSTASATLVGQSLGAKKQDDALTYSRITLRCGLVIGIIGGLVFLLFSEHLFGLFTKDVQVIKTGSAALRVMAFAEPLLCMNIITTGVLRGAGDTKMPFIISLVGMWGVRQACAWFFAYGMGLGLTGAFIGMALDVTVRFILIRIRYVRKKWLYMKVSMD